MQAIPAGAEADGSPDMCDHAKLRFLGSGGDATYYRCAGCGGVLIDQGGRLWTIHRHAPVAG